MNIPKPKDKRVVIVGGGFAGVRLAKSLANKPVQIVLLDQHNYHTFQPLLYQVSTASLEPDSIAFPLRKIIKNHRNTFFRLAKLETINPSTNTVHTDIGELQYDFLVLAIGSTTNFFDNQQIEANSMPMKSIPQALNIRSLILQNLEKATILQSDKDKQSALNFVIVGGGPTGVELAGAIAELKKSILPRDYRDFDTEIAQINLLEGSARLLPAMSSYASAKALQFLKKLGVQVHLNTFVKNYDGNKLVTNTDLELETKTVIWAAGVKGIPINGLDTKSLVVNTNRYSVNSFSQIVGYTNVFAIGDIASMKSDDYPNGHPQVAQPAIQQGKHLAKNILRMIDEQPLIPFKYGDKGSMATIGRNKAVVDVSKFKFAGFIAWVLWVFVHLMVLVGFRNKVVTFFNWSYNYINFDKPTRLIIRPFKK